MEWRGGGGGLSWLLTGRGSSFTLDNGMEGTELMVGEGRLEDELELSSGIMKKKKHICESRQREEKKK